MLKSLAILAASAATLFAQTHSATLIWSDTANPAGTTYNAYRLNGTCPSIPPTNTSGFTKLNTSPVTPKTYADTTVVGGATYCYVVTAANATSESGPSAPAQAPIPSLFVPVMIQITILQ